MLGSQNMIKTVDSSAGVAESRRNHWLGVLVLCVILIFLFAVFVVGDWFGWIGNSQCFQYLGCNIGFFGYDALTHFLGGTVEVSLILWLMIRFPRVNIFHENFWKNFVILLALVALIGVGWEILEFSYDHIRIFLLHDNLLNPNRLFQPSNRDTIGDLTFGLLGALVMIGILKSADSDII